MSYPTYLVHFNKNHDSKNGQFTYGDGDGDGIINDNSNQVRKKYITKDGYLTKAGQTRFEIGKKYSSVERARDKYKDNPKKLKKVADKEYRKITLNNYYDVNDIFNNKFTESIEEAEERRQNDIKSANKNKNFVSDWKNAVKKVFEAMNSGDRYDSSWIDVEEKEIDKLQKKYPKFKDLIYDFSPHEKFSYNWTTNKYNKSDLQKYLNMKPHEETGRYAIGKLFPKDEDWKTYKYSIDPISEMLNYDSYYERKTYSLNKQTASDLYKAYQNELAKYFVKKYGFNIIKE